jgi:hypothetical protein
MQRGEQPNHRETNTTMHGLQEIVYANAAARSRAQAQSIKRHIQDAHRRIAVIRSWASEYPLQPSNPKPNQPSK